MRFWGVHGPGYIGLAGTKGVPMGARVPVLSPNYHQPPAQKGNFSADAFQPKNKPPSVRAHRGVDGGCPKFGPKTPAIG